MLENYNILLENLKNNSHYRDIKDFEGKDEKYIYFKGKKLLNLSSNNYRLYYVDFDGKYGEKNGVYLKADCREEFV